MEDRGKFDKPTKSVPTFYSLENKDNTQVVYIYSSSSEIKREPGEQYVNCIHDEPYNIKPNRNEPHSGDDGGATLPQRRDVEMPRVGPCDIAMDNERIISKGDHMPEYARSWERDRDYGDVPESFRRQRSPAEAPKPKYECKKQTAQRLPSVSTDNFTNTRPPLLRDNIEEGTVMYIDGSYEYNFGQEKRKRDYNLFEDEEKNSRLKSDNGGLRYEESSRAGRKSFTPVRIYPSGKDCYRDRPRYYRRHEYMYAEPPPNVTLVTQDYHRRSFVEDKEAEPRHFEDEDPERDNFAIKHRPIKRVKSEDERDVTNISSRLERPDVEEFHGRIFGERFNSKRYDIERLQAGVGKEKVYYIEKGIARNKDSLQKHEHSPDSNGRQFNSHAEDMAQSSSPTDYLQYSQREKASNFEHEMPVDKDVPYRFNECFGGHEYEFPRKCERYSEMMHEMELYRGKGRKKERRSTDMHIQETEDKIATDQKGYLFSAYQRCCCPCCPCYSVFRHSQRERSPVSSRCSPQKPPASPKLSSRPPSHTSSEPNKPRSSTIVQQMPAELQLKMVARGLPHLRRRRNRTVYTHDQIEELEEVFKIKHYLDVDEKGSIAKRLGIRTENVEIWFKNRRAKWRKEMKTVKSNSDGEVCQYLDEDESTLGDESDSYGRKPLASILSKDVPEERPTMTLYHTGQETCDNDVDSTVVVAAVN